MARNSQWWKVGLSGVFLLALAIRLFVLHEVADSPVWKVLFIDSAHYDAWARRIAAGDWLGEGVFSMAPLYPYFLGIVYKVLGTDIARVLVVQAVLGSGSCLLLALAGRQFFSAQAGLVAGFLLAVYPTAIFSDIQIQKSVLDLLFIGLLLAVFAIARMNPSPRRWALVGGALGCLMLTRENTVVFLPVLLLCMLIEGKGRSRKELLSQGAGLLAGLSLLLAPVAIRNLVRGGELFLTSAQFGYNLYIGNNPQSDGTYTPLIPDREGKEQQDARTLAEAAYRRPLSYGEVSSYWRDKSLEFILGHTGTWLRVMAYKCFLLVNALELPDSYDQYTFSDWSVILRYLTRLFHFGVLFPIAVAGMMVTWKRRSLHWPLYFLILAYAASVVIFFVMARYRLPLVPLLVLFAAAFFAEGVSARSQWKTFLPVPLAAMLAAAVLANWPSKYEGEKVRFKATLLNNIVATIVYQPGRDNEVINLAKEALRLEPGFGPGYYYLGLAYKNQKRYTESLAELQRSAKMLPEIPEPYYRIGQIYFESGNPGMAIAWYRRALSLDPDEPLLLIDLALALHATGDDRGASDATRRAELLGGQDPEVKPALERARSAMRPLRVRVGEQAPEPR